MKKQPPHFLTAASVSHATVTVDGTPREAVALQLEARHANGTAVQPEVFMAPSEARSLALQLLDAANRAAGTNGIPVVN